MKQLRLVGFAAIALVAMTAVAIGQPRTGTFTFVNTQTEQEIQVECVADPRRHAREWWKDNCKPVDPETSDWTGSTRTNHPDFLWMPTGLPD